MRSNSRSFDDPDVAKVWRTLNRDHSVDSLVELHNGRKELTRRPEFAADARLVFAFDTNAVFRLGQNGTKGTNTVDFLRQLASGLVIIPGQIVQELWNNSLAGLEPKARKLRATIEQLEKDMAGIDQHFGPVGEAAREAVELVIESHGNWIDPATQESFEGVLEVLVEVGSVSYVPRVEFFELAQVRHNTKSPPGFRDAAGNHGDFFVWADFLLGLSKTDTTDVDGVVFVTNDSKSDWSRNSEAHPLLVAEAQSLSGLPFRLWTLAKFQTYADGLMR